MNEMVILLPVYEDGECVKKLVRDIAGVPTPSIRILVIDDGSRHAPPDPQALGEAGLRGDVIRLHRNLGQQRAIAIGLTVIHRRLPYCPVLVMDADGQDRADAVPELVRRFESAGAGAVIARRGHRTENRTFRVFYRLYTIMFWLLTGHVMNFGCFALMSSEAVSRLVAMSRLTIHFPASLLATKLPLEFVSVDRGHRYLGVSRMSYLSRLTHAARSVMVFADRMLLRVGVFWCVASGLMLLFTGPILGHSNAGTTESNTTHTELLVATFNVATVAFVLSVIMKGVVWVMCRSGRYSADALLERAVVVSFDPTRAHYER